MSLMRREIRAWVLLLIAAVCWVYGQVEMGNIWDTVQETTAPLSTLMPTEENHPNYNTTATGESYLPETTYSSGQMHMTVDNDPINRAGNTVGFVISFMGVILGIAGVFFLRQRIPLLGPDAVMLFPALFRSLGLEDSILSCFLTTLVVLFSLREIWGWVMDKGNLSWCLVHRLSGKCPRPQESLMVYALSLMGVFWLVPRLYYYSLALACAVASVGVQLGCLWRFGSDLHHFQLQLGKFQKGQPIEPKKGAFEKAERQLLEVQSAQEEAIRTAVTSERFKVDLISNVSHDLRTPLTAILGYSELLGNEVLTAEGQAQLRRLHQKAGYMSDLVDSLFELTKVSSGVVAAKRDEIDLIRLLEQTVGLFDDQLTDAALVVRRNYCAQALTVITDGSRVHQVFANLLGNAIKYALKGTRIYLEVRETENSVRVRMMNTASYEMDFDPEEILQRFARGDKSRSTRGSGLGLAIAQTYTESVGGAFRIEVDGDQFSAIVTLPKNERVL